MLSKDEALALIRQSKGWSEKDPERGHRFADEALCGFLEYLGHDDLVKEYYEVRKYYA